MMQYICLRGVNMSYTVEQFLALDLEAEASDGCTECKKPIDEHPEEYYTISNKPVCSDCYYNSMSELIEKYPIYTPKMIFR